MSGPFCPSVLTDIQAFRGSSIFFDLSLSSGLQASFVHVHVFRGSRRQRHSDSCLTDTHGFSILHTGIAGAYGRYRATENVPSLSKRKKDSFVSLSVSKPSARTSSCGSRVLYGVIAFPTYMAHDFEMFTAAGLRPVRS